VTVLVWPAELPAEPTGDIVTVDGVLEPPDGTGATITPTEASAAAPSMMIDTAMANPAARLRRARTCAFIPSPGEWIYDIPTHPLPV
jgi:hypothetical protein